MIGEGFTLSGFDRPTNRAKRTAGPQSARPASAAQRLAHPPSGQAGPAVNISPAKAQNHDSLLGDSVRPLLIEPAQFVRVGLPAIQLDAQPVFVIQVVQVAVAAINVKTRLPGSRRQPVRPLHPADVPMLKHGLHASGNVTERLGQLPPPAKPAPK